MNRRTLPLLALALLADATPVIAQSGADMVPAQAELPAYLECVPYAREVTGIRIYGDASGWWSQAEERYARGSRPKPRAVLALKPYGAMQSGHVAAVSKVLDSRNILLDHANWSPIGGLRGQAEQGVRALDVSPGNDWSEVRIWYAPDCALGTTRWPVQGFIYPDAAPRTDPPSRPVQVAHAPTPRDPIGAIIGRF